MNTVDFMLGKREAGRWLLLINTGREHIPYARLAFSSDAERQQYHAISFGCRFESQKPCEGMVVECALSKGDEWVWTRFRPDKSTANYVSVVESVLKSIREGVTQEQLLALEPAIRHNWKQREFVAK